MAETKIIPRDQIDAFLAPVPAFTEPRVASIAFGPANEPPRNLATVTAVTIAGARFLVTAKHVITSDVSDREPWRLLVPPEFDARTPIQRRPGAPDVYPLAKDDVIWISKKSDVAILRAPRGLRIKTFDGDKAVQTSRRLRETWDEAADRDAYFPVVVSGFPWFARELEAEKPLYGLISLPGFIVHATRPDVDVDEPRLTLNLGCDTMKPEWIAVPEAVTFAKRLAEDPDGKALGGLSGCPVVAVAGSGYHLAGIVYQGTRALETGFAVPWDLVHQEFSQSLILTIKN